MLVQRAQGRIKDKVLEDAKRIIAAEFPFAEFQDNVQELEEWLLTGDVNVDGGLYDRARRFGYEVAERLLAEMTEEEQVALTLGFGPGEVRDYDGLERYLSIVISDKVMQRALNNALAA